MTEDLAKLRRRLPPWMKPWIPVATLLAIGILGYSYFVATRYWDASGEVTSLTNRLSAVPRIPSEGLEVEKALQDDAISQEQRLEGVRSLFSNLQADELMALAAETGQKARVAVESITVAPLKTETSEEIRYQAYPMTITLLGQATDIFQFISMMNSQVPTEVKDIRIGGLDGDGGRASAQLELSLYVSAEPVSDK